MAAEEQQLHVREEGRMSLDVGGDPNLTTVGYYRLATRLPAKFEVSEGAELRVHLVDDDGTVVAETIAHVVRVEFARRQLKQGRPGASGR